VSRTAGRPVELLRQGSGIRVDGTAGDGLTISHTGLRWRLVDALIHLPLSPYFMEILDPLEVVFLF
jgi:hypothetical protein